ncbi:hypothetical protein PS2_018458 [Malus domestica]
MEDILFYTSLSLIFILFTFKVFLQTKRHNHQNLPPSPPSLPIIGHLRLLSLVRLTPRGHSLILIRCPRMR